VGGGRQGVEVKKRLINIGPGVSIDLDKLMTGRLLLQATSGAGKSWLLRRLLEQSHGMCQQIVIDPEGEFSTLREKFDYVLAAKQGGDTLADVRTAKLLAERLLELGVSAIIDIYELNPDQRVKFVRYFLEAMVDAPKHLWHPVLVVIDEAHSFAPEKGKGEAESASAVKALCTRGRKRGFCAVLATQRLPTLDKDAAAMCANKLIGRASLDADIKRSGAELGLEGKDAIRQIRDLNDGEFYAFGPAISKDVTKVKVGAVQTTHPQAGSQLAARIPPPTDKVKALLPQLSDLPAEAADRERTTAEMKKAIVDKDRRIKELERTAELSFSGTKQEVKQVPALTDADRALLSKIESKLILIDVKAGEIATEAEQRAKRLVEGVLADYVASTRGVGIVAAETVAEILDKASVKKLLEKLNGLAIAPVKQVQGSGIRVPLARVAPQVHAKTPPIRQAVAIGSNGHVTEGLTPAKQKILNGLAFMEGIGVPEADKTQLALIVGVSPTSGAYFNNLGALRTAGLIGYPSGGTVALTDDGRVTAVVENVPTTTDELHEAIRSKLPPAKWKILEALIAVYPNALAKEELATSIGVSPTSGAYFNNLGSLRSLGLLDYPRASEAVAKPVLFLEGR